MYKTVETLLTGGFVIVSFFVNTYIRLIQKYKLGG